MDLKKNVIFLLYYVARSSQSFYDIAILHSTRSESTEEHDLHQL
jgi:hypothetical protein